MELVSMNRNAISGITSITALEILCQLLGIFHQRVAICKQIMDTYQIRLEHVKLWQEQEHMERVQHRHQLVYVWIMFRQQRVATHTLNKIVKQQPTHIDTHKQQSDKLAHIIFNQYKDSRQIVIE